MKRPVEDGIVNIIILNADAATNHHPGIGRLRVLLFPPPGLHTLHCNAGALPLSPGDYFLTVGVAQKGGRLSWDVLKTLPGFRIEAFKQQAPGSIGQTAPASCCSTTVNGTLIDRSFTRTMWKRARWMARRGG